MTLALAGGDRRQAGPPSWLTLAVFAPTALICLPLAYVAARAWQAGLAGVTEELFRRVFRIRATVSCDRGYPVFTAEESLKPHA